MVKQISLIAASILVVAGILFAGLQARYKTKPVPSIVKVTDNDSFINIEGAIGDGRPTISASDYFASKIIDITKENSKLTKMVKEGKKHIFIRINSGGGMLNVGMLFVDTMRAAVYRGVKITCVVDGIAMSMALIIFSECTTRYATFGSKIMWHSLATPFYTPRLNQKGASDILNFMLVKNEEIWRTTRSHFLPWYFIEHFGKETHIPVTTIEQVSFFYLRVINKIVYKKKENK